MTTAELQSPPVHALAATTDSQILCATQSGLRRSSDNGGSWRNAAEPAPTTAICVMDDGRILAAAVGAVQISDDAGASWEARELPSPSTIVSSILATETSVLAATLEDGALRSDDGGRSWRGWNFGLLNWRVNTLCRDAQGIIWAGTESGLFRSDTDGRSWKDQADFTNASILSLEATEAGRLWLGTTGRRAAQPHKPGSGLDARLSVAAPDQRDQRKWRQNRRAAWPDGVGKRWRERIRGSVIQGYNLHKMAR